MNIEEKKEKIAHMHKYFSNSFWLSFVLLLIASFLCIIMHNTQIMFVNKYFPVSVENFNMIVLLTMGIWKVLIIQFTLIPALVLWCMKKCYCKKAETME